MIVFYYYIYIAGYSHLSWYRNITRWKTCKRSDGTLQVVTKRDAANGMNSVVFTSWLIRCGIRTLRRPWCWLLVLTSWYRLRSCLVRFIRQIMDFWNLRCRIFLTTIDRMRFLDWSSIRIPSRDSAIYFQVRRDFATWMYIQIIYMYIYIPYIDVCEEMPFSAKFQFFFCKLHFTIIVMVAQTK